MDTIAERIAEKTAYAHAERIAEEQAFLSDPDFLAVAETDAYAVEIADDIASADAYRAHRASNPVTDVGMYLRPADGAVLKVQPGRYTGNLYAKVLRYDATDPGRSASWEYVPGAIRTITADDRMTLAEAEEFGKAIGICCVCAALLTDPKSIARGIGPVCAKSV